ncbi:MAG: hypothetical protein KGL44_02650 [Sphingomonadales bacterium]|nr:hypothetical protein [Sphingomonadales bacterium]
MTRAIVTPAILPPAALAELKDWLGITTAQDDAPLTALLHTGLELCERFTGLMPLAATIEEVLAITGDWQVLSTRPVQAITGVDGIPADAPRFALPASAYAIDLDADGGGRVRVLAQGAAGRVAVRCTAGLAPDWASLPAPFRQGIMRLAAHQHRTREGDGAAPLPPAAVAALWRPWRQVRLA